MKIKLFVLAMLIISIALEVNAADKKIAITIDDVPMPSTRLFTGIDKTTKIISHLKGINRAGIFVLGTNLSTQDGKNRMKLYDDAGHMIGNHTYSHYNCKKVSSEIFIKDIEKCHELIKNYKNFTPILRYPYLSECNNKGDKVSEFLAKTGYINGYVTIVTLDWYVNYLMQKAIKNGKQVDYHKLRQIYLKTTLDCINFYYTVYRDRLGFSPPHSLLLHENDLNALYLGDLIELLKENNWEIIDPEDVYIDHNIMQLVDKTRKNLPNLDILKPSFMRRLLAKEEVFK